MKASLIEYRATKSFPDILLAYIENDSRLRDFYVNRPSIEEFSSQIKTKKNFSQETRNTLVQELLSQYSPLQIKDEDAVLRNINRLAHANCFTVTTGHQLNIFTGPLYFIFKIVSTIRLTNDLKKHYPEYDFVPVYWMATEDHDFEEINHTYIRDERIQWHTKGNKSATGRMSTVDMKEVVDEYTRLLGGSNNAEKLSAVVKEAYLSGNSLADATRILVHRLFQDYGLVILDADRACFKRLFASYIEQDIFEETSHHMLEQTNQSLLDRGFAAQVNGREINFFYLRDEYRERIIPADGHGFDVLHQDLFFTAQQLKKEIKNHPERFSPNVIMRPLYQEVILPNMAYVGGGSEIAYWLQLKSTFEAYGIPFPILVPRNSAILSNLNSVQKIFRLNLTYKSIFKPLQALQKDYVRRNTKFRLNLMDEWWELNHVFDKIKERVSQIDPTLGPSTDAVRARLKKATDRLEKKLLKADKRNHEDGMQQLDRLKNKFFPGGSLQERRENFAISYLKYGDDLIKDLIQNMDPLVLKFAILYG